MHWKLEPSVKRANVTITFISRLSLLSLRSRVRLSKMHAGMCHYRYSSATVDSRPVHAVNFELYRRRINFSQNGCLFYVCSLTLIFQYCRYKCNVNDARILFTSVSHLLNIYNYIFDFGVQMYDTNTINY